MLSVLVTATVADGHTAPMLAVAAHLVRSGHRVRFLSGERFADAVRRTGAEYLPWPADAFVDHLENADTRERAAGVRGVARGVEEIFIAPGRGQYRAIRAAVAEVPTDVIVTESTVVGAAAVALDPRSRIPVVACGVLPLGLSSVDAAPFGLGILPRSDALGHVRNRALNALVRHVVLRRPQQLAAQLVRELTGGELDVFFSDWGIHADAFAQLTVPGFEYPRSDLAPNVRFVGPVLGASSRRAALPAWWADLDGRTVVHVAQGTVANTDLEELIAPTMRALADRDVIVVAATGGAPLESLGELPANARAAEFIPYDALMPRVDVFVSNGGYGGLHHALAHGVPMVVAGDTEDKMETTRRVEWSGAGVNLHTARPAEAAIADAVDRVLHDAAFRDRAWELRAEIAAAPGLDGLEELIRGVVSTPASAPA
jgi:UDP:flavonoid glycosyltransferase YjiC (YdhE family)